MCCALFTSCWNGLAFRTDERLTITAPRDRAEVTLPVTARWKVRDFEVTGPTSRAKTDAGYFGVFVDRAPQPPGERFAWFARNDRQCLPVEGCPNEKYFTDRGVFSARDTSFTLETLPSTVPVGSTRREFHEITVVLLDGTGRRIGESSWFAQFQVRREED